MISSINNSIKAYVASFDDSRSVETSACEGASTNIEEGRGTTISLIL